MRHTPIELSFEECLAGLRAGTVGRVALSLPSGPRIVPVNYTLQGDAILIRTAPYSELGTYGVETMLAFEVDDFDVESREGWSVVVRGRSIRIDDPGEVRRLQQAWDPEPWAAGMRNLYLRLPLQEVTGRRLGGSWLSSALPAGEHRSAR